MTGVERRNKIINHLQTNGFVNFNDIAKELNVSTMTIRRDLNKLASEGIVSLEQGGAILKKDSLFENAMSFKQNDHVAEKNKIAQACLEYISHGSYFLDSGTTVLELAKKISLIDYKNCIFFTHSLLASNELSKIKDIKYIMCPGEFRYTSMAYIGQLTDQFISNFEIDVLFLAVEGIDLEFGVSVPDIVDGYTKTNLIQKAKKTICLVDSSKFKQKFLYKIINYWINIKK